MRYATKAEALQLYKNNEYKIELIENLEDGTITFCHHSTFTDLCRGGHIPNTGIIKAVKVLQLPVLIGEVMRKSAINSYLWYFISKAKRLNGVLRVTRRS